MEEATEIARLRLFLFLVSSAHNVDELEPLPNIDFNIMAGNSLIGLLNVDPSRFDDPTKTRGLFEDDKATRYKHLLAEKNRLISAYRHASSYADDLTALRATIDAHKAEAYVALDDILLDDFHALNIRYEQAQTNGKAIKRPVTLDDIQALVPFHWGYEFDEIIGARGGFDVIIANPPWEIFKPNSKEFFAEYSDVVSKKKMRIEDFDQEQERLLTNPEVNQAWLEFQSRYPFVSAYYRSAPHYKNQISVVNGKKAGTDINLYKLFTEQCYNLLRPAGQCGIVIPSGIYTDLGAKQLRELLFSATQITGLFGFENRREIFEGVHRSFKFVVLTFEKGGNTTEFPAAFMRLDVAELDQFPAHDSLQMRVEAIRRLAPDSLSIAEFKSDLDTVIAEKLAQFPLLGEDVPDKWSVAFTAELHMTNDSYVFRTEQKPGRLPLYEGKMVHQFTHQWDHVQPRYWVDEPEGRQAALGRTKDVGQMLDYQTYRLGFRDIARNTDSRTLISTMLPPAFHGNKFPTVRIFDQAGNRIIDSATQLFLCAIWNSFTLDYLIRQRVTTTLNFFYLYQLPIPRYSASDPFFAALVERAARLICTTPEFDDLAREVGIDNHNNGAANMMERAQLRAEIDGMVAHLYGLTEVEFAHILSTFPIVSEDVKQAALAAYHAVGSTLLK